MRLLRPRLVLAAALAPIALVGCGHSTPPAPPAPPIPFERPAVALRDVHVTGAGLLGGVVEMTMRLYNPNDYDLASPRVSYRLYLDRVQVSNGAADLDAIVPRHDSALLRVPGRFSYAAVGAAGVNALSTGAARYWVGGRMSVDTPYGRLSFPYDRVGQVAPADAAMRR